MSNKRGRPSGTCTGPARELTPEEITRLTQGTASLRDRALLWMCLGSGMRIGEAATLLIRNLATDGSVVIDAANAKSGKSRRVYLTPQAREHLQAYLASRPDAAPHRPLFPSRSGGWHVSANWACRRVQELLEAAGIQGASSHSLRRTHANTLRRAGTDLTVIQGQLGHQSLATTAVYLSASLVERAEAVGRVRF